MDSKFSGFSPRWFLSDFQKMAKKEGGHSDLQREKLVYNSFFLVHGGALKVSMVT